MSTLNCDSRADERYLRLLKRPRSPEICDGKSWARNPVGIHGRRAEPEIESQGVPPVHESRWGFEPVFSAFTSVCARDVCASSRARSFTERGPDGLRYFCAKRLAKQCDLGFAPVG